MRSQRKSAGNYHPRIGKASLARQRKELGGIVGMQTDVPGATTSSIPGEKTSSPGAAGLQLGIAAGQVGGVAIGAGRPAGRQRAER